MAKGTTSIRAQRVRHRLQQSAAGTGRGLTRALLLLGSLSLGTACGEFGGGGGGGGGGGFSGGGASASLGGGGSSASTEERIAAFSATTYPILRDYCTDCHAGSGPGTPHIANADPAVAYAAVVDNQKANLSTPETSRLVRRLVTDFHHCWSNCVMDGAEMQASIAAWAAAIDFGSGGTQVDGIVSSSLTFDDGFEDEGQERYTGNVIALYEFKEGEGEMAMDTSGVSPAMNLEISGEVEWMPNYGLHFADGRAMASASSSRKLYDRLADPDGGSQQYSVEAWLAPDNIEQEGPARMVTYSNGTQERNFTLGQNQYNFNFRNRNINNDVNGNGQPALETPDAEQDLQAALQHVVITYDQYRGRRIYVNGDYTDDGDPVDPMRLWNWDSSHRFAVGNETSNNRDWEGQARLVAVYEVALSEAQIVQNYNAGIGKRVVFRFDVSQWISGAYVEMLVSELDAGSYLFCAPTFVSPGVTNARLANMRILVNGQAPVSGQAFVNVDAVMTSTRQEISQQCSVIPKDAGPMTDIFTLEFEYLGGFENPIVQPPPGTPPPRVFGGPMPDEGVRSFARINETMASVTGVSPNNGAVRATFDELTQQLPGTTDVRTFSSAHQVAMAKLSLEYCDQLVETNGLRNAFFDTTPQFAFGQPPTVALATPADRDLLFDPLVDGILGVNVANQPSRAEVRPILDALVDQLLVECATEACGADKTRTVAKATCAAVLSNAAVSMH